MKNIVKSYVKIHIYEFIYEFMLLNSWLCNHRNQCYDKYSEIMAEFL